MNKPVTLATSHSRYEPEPDIRASTSKVICNTYTLLSMALWFSALSAGVSVALNLPHPGLLLTL